MNIVAKRVLLTFIHLSLAGFILSVVGLSALYLYLSPNLPSVESIREVKLQTPLRVFSSDGKLIGEFGEKRRTPVTLDEVPQPFIDALLSAEDANFYSHNGVSIKGLARAATELIATGRRGSGGSTLTMQLTRNVFLTLEKKFARKLNEILLSLKLERELSKDEILELYVNYMFLGKRAYGIQAAAQVYYGKTLEELSLAQHAMVAGLFQSPSTKNPIVAPQRAKDRRDWILRRMLSRKLISQEEYEKAINEEVSASFHGNKLDMYAPYAAELAREKTIRSFGIQAYTEGYRVYTTIDSRFQQGAQDAVAKGVLAYDKRHGYRGPEQTLDIALLPQDIPDQTSPGAEAEDKEADNPDVEKPNEENGTANQTIENPYSAWIEALASIPSYQDLEPAAVTGVNNTTLSVLLKNGKIIEIGEEQGLYSYRPYINENARGAKPQKPGDVAAIGDVIRVTQETNGTWRFSQLPAAQAALVAIAPKNGEILSITGGFDFNQSNFNRATQAYRQPGSNFKPFIYTAALENGFTAASLINDAPIVFEDATLEATWRPENDGGNFLGPTRMRKALYLSRNLVSIRLLRQLGIGSTVRSLERFGFDPKALPRDLSLALGTHAVTPIDIATAWATFANGGYKVDAHLIHQVKDFDGNIIYQALPRTVCDDCEEPKVEEFAAYTPEIRDDPDLDEFVFDIPIDLKRSFGLLEADDYPKAPRIVDEQVVFIMDSMLKDVIQRGTGRRARVLQRSDIAGKTGTTNGPNDAWFSGYSRDVVATTWLGFDQNLPLGNNEYGGSAALPIWIDFMRVALTGKPQNNFSQPPGVVTVKIDPETGERARIDDPDAIFEYFRTEYVPEQALQNNGTEVSDPSTIFSEELF